MVGSISRRSACCEYIIFMQRRRLPGARRQDIGHHAVSAVAARGTPMSSITGRQPFGEDNPQRLLWSECGGLLDLFLPKAMRRVSHFLLAVALTKSDLRRFDLLLHKLMEEGRDGPLRASYCAGTSYTSERKDSLDEILSEESLPDVVYELIIRLEDGRRSIEVLFSRRGVVSRLMGGAFEESWEARGQKAVSAFLAEKRAKFLAPLFALVLLLLGGSFYLMYLMAVGPNALDALTKVFYASYISISFVSTALFWMHQRGVLFPHAKIAIRDAAGGDGSSNIGAITGVLGLIIQVVRLIADYFILGSRTVGSLRRRRPADATAARPPAAD